MTGTRLTARAAALAAAATAVLAGAGCGSSSSSVPVFHPAGKVATSAPPSASAAATAAPGPDGFVMPPFGKNAHVEMTSWLPSNAAQAAAVNADKDYELAFWYSEYTSGKDQSWTSYVAAGELANVRGFLAKPETTTQSWEGTAKVFDMRAIPDPVAKNTVDVSACVDIAGVRNTSAGTGQALPPGPADQNYYRITDQVQKSAGKWLVTGSLPSIYYPRAKECKP